MPHARYPALRLALFYAAAFAVLGVHLPFWPMWLSHHGITEAEIGVLSACGAWVRVVGNPAVAHFADRHGERRRLMVGLAIVGALAFALFAVNRSFVWLLGVTLLYTVATSSVLVLGESLGVLTAVEHGFDWGRTRVFGSLAFIAVAVGSGPVIKAQSPTIVWWLVLGLLVLVIGASAALTDTRTAKPARGAPAPAKALLAQPLFWCFLLAASLTQASHAAYYQFGTLHWIRAGHSETVVGVLWAEGVLAEIVLFALGPLVMRRVSASGLVLLGALAGVLRWALTAASSDLALLVLVQPLHALTFGATHLGAIKLIAATVPADCSATAQSLYAALGSGGLMGLALLAAGTLFAHYGGAAFWAMAALALVGAVCALVIHIGLARRGPGFRFGGWIAPQN